MKRPPEPTNERQRLEALHQTGLLDTPPEERFDRITRIAQYCFGTQIVLVSLVDEHRQWFKSRQGLSTAQTPRVISFCGHAILDDDLLVVEDTHRDARFKDNPLVIEEPHIRFYVGAPLKDRSGFRLGTLCLIDSKARIFGASERKRLRDLADCVEDQIGHRQVRVLNQELKASEQRFRTLFDLSPVGMALNELETGVFVDANPAFVQSSGYTKEQLHRMSSWQLVPDKYQEQELSALTQVRDNGCFPPIEVELTHAQGHNYRVRVQGALTQDIQGKALVWSLVEDLAEKHRLERMKQSFVARVSHELRTPLTAMIGALGLLQGSSSERLTAGQHSLLDNARRNSQSLARLVNDILDMEKLASGAMVFDFKDVALPDLVRQRLEKNRYYDPDKAVSLELATTAGDVWVRVDEHRLEQALDNLLSNAIKFSAHGGLVTVAIEPQENSRVRIKVQDSGPGIDENFEQEVFEQFSQGRNGGALRGKGTGLGLAITRDIMKKLGGDIGFNSRPGQGACFWLELPLIAN